MGLALFRLRFTRWRWERRLRRQARQLAVLKAQCEAIRAQRAKGNG